MEPAFQQIIGVHGARMYYNLTSIHSVLRLAPFGDALAESFDAFVGARWRRGRDEHAIEVGRRGAVRQAGEVAVIAADARLRCCSGSAGASSGSSERVDEFAGARRTVAARATLSARRAATSLLAGFIEIRCHSWLDASLGRCGGDGLLRRARAAAARARAMDAAVHTSLLKAHSGRGERRARVATVGLSRLVRATRRSANCSTTGRRARGARRDRD